MPLPHEKVAIDRARGKRREQLVEAAAVLDRVRAGHPGVNDLRQLPPEIRDEAQRALRTFGLGSRNAIGTPELALTLMLAVGLGLLWFKPVREFRCAPQGPGLARCAVRERLFGLLPIRGNGVSGIAKARAQERSTSSESRGSDGRTRTVTTHVYELSFKGADEQELWSASESHLIGARYDRLAAEVEELASGERAVELVRLHAIWPVLLAGSLFVTLAVSVLGTKLGMALRDRGLIPEAVFRPVFYWGPLLVPVALFGWAWLVSLLGKDPPRVVAALLAALS